MKKYSGYIILIVLINLAIFLLTSTITMLVNPIAIILIAMLLFLSIWGLMRCFIKIAINIISDGIKLSKEIKEED